MEIYDFLPQSKRLEIWENALRVLLAMDEHTRTHHFNMHTWLSERECGTVGCIAGHCALDPWFQKKYDFRPEKSSYNGRIYGISKSAEDIFGTVGYRRVLTNVDLDWERAVTVVQDFIALVKSDSDLPEWLT